MYNHTSNGIQLIHNTNSEYYHSIHRQSKTCFSTLHKLDIKVHLQYVLDKAKYRRDPRGWNKGICWKSHQILTKFWWPVITMLSSAAWMLAWLLFSAAFHVATYLVEGCEWVYNIKCDLDINKAVHTCIHMYVGSPWSGCCFFFVYIAWSFVQRFS